MNTLFPKIKSAKRAPGHSNAQSNAHSTITPAKRARILRVGLLITTILLGFFLVFLGVFEYRDAKTNGHHITRAQALYMMLGFQKQMRRRQTPSVEATRSLYDMLLEQGVQRVELYENGLMIHGFGTAQLPLNPSSFARAQSTEPVAIQFVTEELVHARIALPPPPGRGSPRDKQLGRPLRDRRPGNHPARHRSVMLELVPTQAIAMGKRAFQIMIVDIITAFLLMGTAIVFWKLSVRQERLMLQLEKDKQLKLLGQMSAVLGHELKNTIASVKGHSQLLVEKLTGTPHESNAALIEKDSKYLQNLTEQMLAFARTGAMHLEKVYLDDLAEAAVTFSEVAHVNVTVTGDVPTFYLDRHKMQQVLTNLINNAHQSGASQITLSMTNSSHLQITVEDNGDGMDHTQQEKIFEPFFTTHAKGTGLGLALAQQVVAAHNGTIEVKSTPQQGSSFTIVLPPPASGEHQ